MGADVAHSRRRLVLVDSWPVAVAIAAVTGAAIALLVFLTSPLLACVASTTVAAGTVILRRPLAGILVFVGIATLLPFAVFPVRLVFAPTLVDLALILLLLGWALPALHQRRPVVITPLGGLVLLFMGLAVVALVLGSGSAPVGGETLRLFLKALNSILLFFSVAQVVRTLGDLARITRAIIFGGVVAAMMALSLYALPRDAAVDALSSLSPLGYPAGSDVIRVVAETDVLRATGTSIDPNVLGGLLMLTIALATAQLLTPHSVLARPVLLVCVLAMVGAIGLTYSRSSWLGAAAGIVFLACKERRLWLAVGPGVAGLLLVPQGQAMLMRLLSGVQARDPAAAMRLGEYSNALAIISQYPWFGVGFGDAPDIGVGVGVSNVYLQIAEQMGLVGLVAFVAIVVGALAWSLRARVARGDRAWAAHAGLQAALVAAVVAGLFDHYFFNIRFPHMVGVFWLLLSLLVVSTRLRSSDGPPPP